MQPVVTDVAPAELAGLVLARLPGALLGFDVDGVLAPLVAHADAAALTPGVAESLALLARRCEVVVLSGRSLASLRRMFEFSSGLHVVGSHGLEFHGGHSVELSDDEQRVYELLTLLGRSAVQACGPGAWLEYKPASVVVHTREAHAPIVPDVLDMVRRVVDGIEGATIKPGHHVIELMARHGSKGDALLDIGKRVGATSLVFLGDDVTDEDAFARMGPDDVSVRVGPGPTIARYRLGGPTDAAEYIDLLAKGLSR
jgi:trehalose 6-phosphate phosphatase